MAYKVQLLRPVSRAIGTTGMERAAKLRLLNWVYQELESGAPQHRHNRVPGRAECFFLRKAIVQGQTWFDCTFVVADRTEPDEMIVLQLMYERRSAT